MSLKNWYTYLPQHLATIKEHLVSFPETRSCWSNTYKFFYFWQEFYNNKHTKLLNKNIHSNFKASTLLMCYSNIISSWKISNNVGIYITLSQTKERNIIITIIAIIIIIIFVFVPSYKASVHKPVPNLVPPAQPTVFILVITASSS